MRGSAGANGNAHASNVDVAEAITELHDATWDNFADRLARFVSLMTGTAEFSILMLRDGALKPVFHPADDHRQAADAVVAAEDPLFAAIVNEKRILSATRIADRTLLGNRGVLAGPLVDPQASDRVLGMFAIAGAALDDHPEDIERRFALTVSEVSRLVGRIVLMENWQAAAAPGQANGHAEKPHDAASNGQGGVQQGDAPQDGAPQAGTPRAASGRRPRRDREVTLQ
jgi:GAF domain